MYPLACPQDFERKSFEKFRRLVDEKLGGPGVGSLTFTPTSESKKFCSDPTLIRYLRARDHDHTLSMKLLLGTLQWRETEKPLAIRCPKCSANPLAHNMRIIGFDNLGRPVLYT